jgi:uncharacterized RDD family membrane protein YckC
MPIVFKCGCGETLSVEEALKERKVFCPKCRKSIEVPADAKVVTASELKRDAPSASAAEVPAKGFDGVLEPRHVERIPAAAGEPERWKLTCYCGKRIVSPFKVGQPTGRCPKCGRRLKLPGYKPERSRRQSSSDHIPAKPVPPTPGLPETMADMKLADVAKAEAALAAEQIGAPRKPKSAEPNTATLTDDLNLQPVAKESKESPEELRKKFSASSTLDLHGVIQPQNLQGDLAAEPAPDNEDEIGTIVMDAEDAQAIRETGANKAAAVHTADILRAHKISTVERSGLISAWPLAGKLPRALAGFIDLTFATTAMGTIIVLASLKILPESCQHFAVALAAFLAAGMINDVFLQMTGGTLGKRLVVLALRRRGGRPMDAGRTVLRAVLKWLLIPGWIIAFVDPAERALHDLICGTLVLKGRTR